MHAEALTRVVDAQLAMRCMASSCSPCIDVHTHRGGVSGRESQEAERDFVHAEAHARRCTGGRRSFADAFCAVRPPDSCLRGATQPGRGTPGDGPTEHGAQTYLPSVRFCAAGRAAAVVDGVPAGVCGSFDSESCFGPDGRVKQRDGTRAKGRLAQGLAGDKRSSHAR